MNDPKPRTTRGPVTEHDDRADQATEPRQDGQSGAQSGNPGMKQKQGSTGDGKNPDDN